MSWTRLLWLLAASHTWPRRLRLAARRVPFRGTPFGTEEPKEGERVAGMSWCKLYTKAGTAWHDAAVPPLPGYRRQPPPRAGATVPPGLVSQPLRPRLQVLLREA